MSGYSGNMPVIDMNVQPPPYIPIERIIANGDFTYATLCGSINSVPYEPGYLGKKGLFHYVGSLTRSIMLEFDGQTIGLVQSSAPQSPGTIVTRKPRSMATFTAPRIAMSIPVHATEVAAIRALAATDLETIETQAGIRIRNAVRNLRSTWEWHRVNAAMGILLDADGSVLVNYFTALGVAQPTFDFNWTNVAIPLLDKCAALLNDIEDALGGNFNPEGNEGTNSEIPDTPPLILCGRIFWQNLMADASFQKAYTYFQERGQTNNPLRDDLRYKDDFFFGGFYWRQYRGSTTATGQFIPTATAQVIINNLPGTYEGYFCPPEDVIDAVNKPGIPIVCTVQEMEHKAGLEFRIQSNPLHTMNRPGAAFQCFSSEAGPAG
jgi:hypothetical protein